MEQTKESTTQALGDYCLIKKLGQEDRVVNGILISNSQQAMLSKAEVLSVGAGKKIKVLNLEVGDVIWFNDLESNMVSTDSLGTGGYFLRSDFIFGKEATNK